MKERKKERNENSGSSTTEMAPLGGAMAENGPLLAVEAGTAAIVHKEISRNRIVKLLRRQ